MSATALPRQRSRIDRFLGAAPIGSQGARTLLIVGGGFAALQLASSFLLANIAPGRELEEIAT